MNQEILKFCIEKGLLLDEEVLRLLSEGGDVESAKLILERIKNQTHKKIITTEIFQDKKQASQVFFSLPEQNQKRLEKLKIKLGLKIEILKQVYVEENSSAEESLVGVPSEVRALSLPTFSGKKIEVPDFTKYFRSRYSDLKQILQNNSQLDNLVSINKIWGNKQGVSIIGMVSDKRVTKNRNILLEVEDFTGKIKVVVNQNKKEIYEKAEDIALDSVIGIKGSGSREILFVNDIIFPEAMIPERKKSPVEEYALFIGDLHFGSKLFLGRSFLKFIDYLNGKLPNTPEVSKIKYLFIVGDIVTGVGNYPNQERDLQIVDLEEQFLGIAGFLGKIRKDITIIISPGNHDGVRLMEPQPTMDEKYSWPLHKMENVIMTGNPTYVNIASRGDFKGFDVLTYHGFSYPFYANNISKLMGIKAMNCPENIMKYLLKNRHLAPTHASVQYFPLETDPLVIKNIPDIFVSGHTHKSGVSYYNNVLIVSISCWEGMTAYQEKFGNTPDHCKVPLLNLKTREVKMLDFEEPGEIQEKKGIK